MANLLTVFPDAALHYGASITIMLWSQIPKARHSIMFYKHFEIGIMNYSCLYSVGIALRGQVPPNTKNSTVQQAHPNVDSSVLQLCFHWAASL